MRFTDAMYQSEGVGGEFKYIINVLIVVLLYFSDLRVRLRLKRCLLQKCSLSN